MVSNLVTIPHVVWVTIFLAAVVHPRELVRLVRVLLQVSIGHRTADSQIHVAKHSVNPHPVQLVSIFKVVELTPCLRGHAFHVPTCRVVVITTTPRTEVSQTVAHIKHVPQTVLLDSIALDVAVRVRVHVYPAQMHFWVSTTWVMEIYRTTVRHFHVKATAQMDSTEIPVRVRAADLVWRVQHADRSPSIQDVVD